MNDWMHEYKGVKLFIVHLYEMKVNHIEWRYVEVVAALKYPCIIWSAYVF